MPVVLGDWWREGRRNKRSSLSRCGTGAADRAEYLGDISAGGSVSRLRRTRESVCGKCSECRGSGHVKKSEEIPLDIPAGIEDGQMLSLSRVRAKQGGGESGGRSLVAVHVRPHPIFSRRGNDVLSNISISAVRAALGDTVEVETIDGQSL